MTVFFLLRRAVQSDRCLDCSYCVERLTRLTGGCPWASWMISVVANASSCWSASTTSPVHQIHLRLFARKYANHIFFYIFTPAPIATGGGGPQGWRIRSSTTRTGCWYGPCLPASHRGHSTVTVETCYRSLATSRLLLGTFPADSVCFPGLLSVRKAIINQFNTTVTAGYKLHDTTVLSTTSNNVRCL